MVVGTTFFLINIHDPVQVWEVPVQIYSLGIAATYKPVLQLTWLKKATQKPSLCITAVSTYVRSRSVLSKISVLRVSGTMSSHTAVLAVSSMYA